MSSSRSGSPLFDVPEIPALRRVKPLPKRRRTSTYTGSLPLPPQLPTAPLSGDGFLPILNGGGDDGGGSTSEGEYPDAHAGNTKKRKVPAHALRGPDARAAESGVADDPASGDSNGVDEPASDPNAFATATATSADGFGDGGLTLRIMNRLHVATRVGLARKEMLRARKRQFGAALGTPTHGETLALDQALALRYPLLSRINNTSNGSRPKNDDIAPLFPKSRRRIAWSSQDVFKIGEGTGGEVVDVEVPTGDFTFKCHSATGDRHTAIQAEVAALQALIEAELARQVARAEEAARIAAEHAAAARLAAKARPMTTITPSHQSAPKEPAALPLPPNSGNGAPPSATNKKGKKKKRSALANASNPHHLRNYVPSRLPNRSLVAKDNKENLLSPLPVRFLAAGTGDDAGLAQGDDWICPMCEYRLFYGGDAEYRMAIRNRKKILKRRKRARERAAAAASGKRATAPAPAPAPSSVAYDTTLPDRYGSPPIAEAPTSEFDEDEYEDEDDPGDELEFTTMPRYADGIGAGDKGRIKHGG